MTIASKLASGFAVALAVLGCLGGSSWGGLAGAEPAYAQERQFPVRATANTDDLYPARLQSWPEGVTSLADVTYSTIPGYRPMIMDIYLPPREQGPRPLIMYVHGGAFIGGHTRHGAALANFPAALASLAAEGFVVASVEYRLASEAPFPAQAQDVRSALRFLKDHAEHYGIDPERSGIWGGSSGGHLAAMAALSCGDASLDPAGTVAPAGSECVQAAVIWYGVFDFAAFTAGRAPGSVGVLDTLLGCEEVCGAEDYAPASPVTYIDASDPPMLLIHGNEDKVLPVAQSHLGEERLRAAGVRVDSIYIPQVDHSFVGPTPEITRAANWRAVNATYDFFHAMLDGDGE
jgi:acetyl esterase/lipase